MYLPATGAILVVTFGLISFKCVSLCLFKLNSLRNFELQSSIN